MCAMLSALGVVMLYIGSLIQVMDLSMAVIASICCIFAVIEYGKSAPWLVFATTSVLSLILLPQKAPAVIYICFFGYYPIIKEKLERLAKPVSWVLKEVVFNVALAIMMLLSRFVFVSADAEPLYIYIATVVLAEIAFPLYDVALTRVISFYVYKIRSRIKFK